MFNDFNHVRIVSSSEYGKFKKDFSYDNVNFVFPKKINNNKVFFIGYLFQNTYVSFLFVSLEYTTEHGSSLYISYSYTKENFRNMGFSTKLRNYLINYGFQHNFNNIISVPFENANSKSILEKCGFQKNGNLYKYHINNY